MIRGQCSKVCDLGRRGGIELAGSTGLHQAPGKANWGNLGRGEEAMAGRRRVGRRRAGVGGPAYVVFLSRRLEESCILDGLLFSHLDALLA